MDSVGLYIHVPFCERKCPYCDFYSEKATDELLDKYTKRTCEILIGYSKELSVSFDTLYFGGGTPSLLGNDNLIKIISTVKDNFIFSKKEITLEMNPSTLPILDLGKLRENGVNRLSIGVQSAVDDELKQLGRSHSLNDARKTIEFAKKSGFTNISLDLMIATPGQTLKTLKESIDFCANQDVQHVSAYLLKVEKGTLFYKNKHQLDLKNETEEAKMYLFAVSELERHNFKQYEISNFCKEGYMGKHNLKYWNAEEYLGIGPSAHSFINGKRFFYPRSLKDFLNANACAIDDGIGGSVNEYIMLRLRLKEGLNNDTFKKRFGYDIGDEYLKKAKTFEKHDLLSIFNKDIKLTPKGFLVSNELISRIIL